MTLMRRDCEEIGQRIRQHQESNPFNSNPFSLDQVQVLADVAFGNDTHDAKEEWIRWALGNESELWGSL